MSISFLVAMSIISLMPVLAQGATYYVSKTGSNENSCSHSKFEKTPKLTVNGGLACMKSGDTLYIKAGTYKEFINHKAIPSGSEGNHTVVSSFDNDRVTLLPLTGGGGGDVVWFYGQHHITLSGLILDGSNVSVQGIRFNNGSHHILIRKTEVKNAHQSNCIGVNDGSSHSMVFDQLKVHDCADGGYRLGHGIYIRGSDHVIKNSEIYNHGRETGYGIHQFANEKVNHRIKIFGNKVFNNAATGILIGSGDGNVAYNNIVWNNGFRSTTASYGIRIGFKAIKNNQIYNNTVYGNAGTGISIRKDASNSIVQNNIMWQNGRDEVDDNGTGSIISHNLTSNPDFLDEDGFDFRLNLTSPAIDAGIHTSIVSVDSNGIRRPQQLTHDVGAYEYLQSKGIDKTAPEHPKRVRIVE